MIIHGDCIEEMQKLEENSVDAIVTDPPYGLEFMGKDWDKGVPGQHFWEEMIRVLKPGGFLLSFSGTRTYHRMVTHIEDAGFEIRDMISWLYGSGFPKSLNIGKQIDKITGRMDKNIIELKDKLNQLRELKGYSKSDMNKLCGFEASNYFRTDNHLISIFPTREKWIKIKSVLECGDGLDKIFEEAEREIIGKGISQPVNGWQPNGKDKSERFNPDITKGNSEWEGWGTALKPACEPIVVARKPFSEKNTALNVLKHGTGGINIDACRIGTGEDKIKGGCKGNTNPVAYNLTNNPPVNTSIGRFPANIILDEEAGKILDEQSGMRESGKSNNNAKIGEEGDITPMRRGTLIPRFDKGGASRFFYCAKSSKSERNLGCNILTTVKLIKHKDIELLWNEENMELAQLLLKDILGLEAMSLNIGESGDNIMAMCQKECLSTIKMEINKITELKTWSSLTHYLTKDYIQDVFLKKEDGLNHVEFVKNLKKLMMKTGISQERVGLVMEDVKNATYQLLLMLKENEDWQDFKNFHSTVKPIKLMEYLIKLVSREGATVLDPFLGSGTTAIAALKLNRKFIGIEKEEDYIKIIKARIKPFLEQATLKSPKRRGKIKCIGKMYSK